MKRVCLNYQSCSYYEYLDSIKDEMLCISCPECNSIAVLVKDTFNTEHELSKQKETKTVINFMKDF
jgi:ssDNA-binding Zn-finger/Zn-ribbon topoisomerase 1